MKWRLGQQVAVSIMNPTASSIKAMMFQYQMLLPKYYCSTDKAYIGSDMSPCSVVLCHMVSEYLRGQFLEKLHIYHEDVGST
jgi:hypothetical protein